MIGVPLAAAETIAALAARVGGEPDSEVLDRVVERVLSPERASEPRELVLVIARRHLAAAQAAAGVLLCSPELADALPLGRRWIHRHALWVLSRILPQPAAECPATDVLAGVVVGTGAVIFEGARIGSGTVLGPGAVVYGGVTLGARVVVGANAVIGRPGFGWTNSPDGEVVRVPQLGGVLIEDDVEIGPLSTVDAGTLGPTRIGRGTKLDAQVHVGHNAEIGPGCLIAAQTGLAGSVRLGAGVQVGGQSGFADHVSVGDGARIAAKSGVIGDVPAGATVAGFPAVARMRWLRAMARLMDLAKSDRRR